MDSEILELSKLPSVQQALAIKLFETQFAVLKSLQSMQSPLSEGSARVEVYTKGKLEPDKTIRDVIIDFDSAPPISLDFVVRYVQKSLSREAEEDRQGRGWLIFKTFEQSQHFPENISYETLNGSITMFMEDNLVELEKQKIITITTVPVRNQETGEEGYEKVYSVVPSLWTKLVSMHSGNQWD